MDRFLLFLAAVAIALNFIALRVRLKFCSPINIHKIHRFILIVCNILCCVAIFIVQCTQESIAQPSTELPIHNITQRQCLEDTSKVKEWINSRRSCNKSEVKLRQTIWNISNVMLDNNLCYMQLDRLFFMLKVGFKPLLGNYLSHPFYILDQVVRIFMGAFSVYKVVSVRFCLNKRRRADTHPVRHSIIQVVAMLAVAASLNAVLYGVFFKDLNQDKNRRNLGLFVAHLMYIPLLCKLIVILWYCYLFYIPKLCCTGKKEVEQTGDKEQKLGDSGYDEPGYQSWQGLGPSSLGQLPSTTKLNLVQAKKVSATQPPPAGKTKVTWDSLPDKFKIAVKGFLWTASVYAIVHLVALGLVYWEYHKRISESFKDSFPDGLSIGWVLHFLDCFVVVLCFDEFLVLFVISKWRRRVKKMIWPFCRRVCFCGKDEEESSGEHQNTESY